MQHYVPKSYGDKTSDTHILFSSAPAQVPAETKYCFWRVEILKRRIGGICHEIIRNSADSLPLERGMYSTCEYDMLQYCAFLRTV